MSKRKRNNNNCYFAMVNEIITFLKILFQLTRFMSPGYCIFSLVKTGRQRFKHEMREKIRKIYF